MKSFDEFWNSISDEEFENIVDSVQQRIEQAASETTKPSNILGNQIGAACINFTYQILRHYHEWLSEQVD